MGYDLGLYNDNDEPVTVPNYKLGSVYALGGSTEAEIKVTYNYSPVFSEVFPENGIRWLYGKSGKETVETLKGAVKKLGTVTSGDYWECTHGNVGYVLALLLQWAIFHPDAKWNGD